MGWAAYTGVSGEAAEAAGTPDPPPKAIIGIVKVSSNARLQRISASALLPRTLGIIRFMLMFRLFISPLVVF